MFRPAKPLLILAFSLLPVFAQSDIHRVDAMLKKKLASPQAQTTLGSVQVLQEMEAEYDKELNRAYKELMKDLTGETKAAFQVAQKKWIAFRDSQFEAFKAVYDPKEFGSGQGPCLAERRMNLVRDRVVQIMSYSNGLWGDAGKEQK